MDSPPTDRPLATADARAAARDDLFDALSHARRRFVLQHLRSSDRPVSVDDLSSELAAWEDDASSNHASGRVALSLLHVHLPKLADAGLVEYDEQWRRVALADDVDELHSMLQVVSDRENQ